MRRAVRLLVVATAPALAHDPITTKLLWTQEISRLMYKHCVVCHRQSGSAMSLATYDEARPWAKAIRDEVIARRMPPWGAVKGVGEFRDDPSLSQIEIDMIVNWVEGGAPEGDEIYLPPAPHFNVAPMPDPGGKELMAATGSATILPAPADLSGLRPVQLATGESLEVTAIQPDGTVNRLIWIRGWRPEWQRTYYFRNPLKLPKGTRIVAYSGKPAQAAILVSWVKR